MSAKPGYLKTLEYGGRWGIEAMFSDFKSRGFGVEDTHIHYSERLGRLVLVMAPLGRLHRTVGRSPSPNSQ